MWTTVGDATWTCKVRQIRTFYQGLLGGRERKIAERGLKTAERGLKPCATQHFAKVPPPDRCFLHDSAEKN
jgi:hypothetical protein